MSVTLADPKTVEDLKPRRKRKPVEATGMRAKSEQPSRDQLGERTFVVDELIAVESKLAPMDPLIKRRDALRKTVRSWAEADELAGNQTRSYKGSKGGMVVLGQAENQRKFKKGAIRSIYKALGLEGFLAAVSITLKAAETMLGDRLAEFIYEERTGTRDITIVEAS